MAKTKISEYDSTAANNTDIDGVNLAEGCPPSGINNAIREVMAHLKDWQSGVSGDGLSTSGTITSSGTLNVTGNFQIGGSAGTSGYYLKSQGAGSSPVWADLGLGTMSTQNSSAVNITGGTLSGVTVGGYTIGNKAAGTQTISTSSPTGGSSGDVWYKV